MNNNMCHGKIFKSNLGNYSFWAASRIFALSLCLLSTLPGTTYGSMAEGVQIKIHHFELNVVFDPVIDSKDRDEGIKYLADSGGLLFDMIYLIQENYELVKNLDGSYRISVEDQAPKIIWVTKEEKDIKKYPDLARNLAEKHITGTIQPQDIRLEVCKILNVPKCAVPPGNSVSTFLYKLKEDLPFDSQIDNAVQFGAMPGASIEYLFRNGKEKTSAKTKINRTIIRRMVDSIE